MVCSSGGNIRIPTDLSGQGSNPVSEIGSSSSIFSSIIEMAQLRDVSDVKESNGSVRLFFYSTWISFYGCQRIPIRRSHKNMSFCKVNCYNTLAC